MCTGHITVLYLFTVYLSLQDIRVGNGPSALLTEPALTHAVTGCEASDQCAVDTCTSYSVCTGYIYCILFIQLSSLSEFNIRKLFIL